MRWATLLVIAALGQDLRLPVPIIGGEIRGPDEAPAADPCLPEEVAAVVGGVVVAGESPVVGAEIAARRLDGPPGAAVARSGAGGAFALGLVPGRWRLVARAPGRAPAATEIEVRPAYRRLDLGLALPPPAGRIAVRVVGPAGAPIAGAVVSAAPDARAVTDADGRADLDVGAAGPHRLVVEAPGFFDAGPAARSVRAGAMVVVRLAPKTAVLSGAVVGPTYDPIPGAWVRAVPRDAPADGGGRVRADRRGRWRLDVAPGAYRLEVEAPGLQPADPRLLDVVVADGERIADHAIPLRRADLQLVGTPDAVVVPAAETAPPAAVLCARAFGPFGVVLRWRLDVPRYVDPLVDPRAYRVFRAEMPPRAPHRRTPAGEAPPPVWEVLDLAATDVAEGIAAATDAPPPGRYLYAIGPPGAAAPAGRPAEVDVGTEPPRGIPFLEPLSW